MSNHFVKLSYRSVTLQFSTQRENYVHPCLDTVHSGVHSLWREIVLSLDGVWGGGGSWSCVKLARQTLLTLRGKTYPFWGVSGGWKAGEGEGGATGVDMQNEKYFFKSKKKTIVDVNLEIASLTEFPPQKTFLQPPCCIRIQFSA